MRALTGDIIDELSTSFGARFLDIYWDASAGDFVLKRGTEGYPSLRLDKDELRKLGLELIELAEGRRWNLGALRE